MGYVMLHRKKDVDVGLKVKVDALFAFPISHGVFPSTSSKRVDSKARTQ
jgi:hypothetical protein